MSEAAKHTPGPWVKVQLGTNIRIRSTGPGGLTVASLAHYRSTQERHANAHLIAAAPAMKGELEQQRSWLLHWIEDVRSGLKPTPESLEKCLSDVEAAIAKAEGRK